MWAQDTGGAFDIIVDDGGHTSKQIFNTFEIMWPHVNRGGLYFIEDLSFSRMSNGGFFEEGVCEI